MNVRVSLFGQTAPIGSDGIGRLVLYRCPECQRIWLQDARSSILDLRAEQVQALCLELQADMAKLPLAHCRFCLWKSGGGCVYFDEYGGGKGYGLTWELPLPAVTHVNCCVQSLRWNKSPVAMLAGPDVLTNPTALRAVLDWAPTAAPPRTFSVLGSLLCELQGADMKAGFGREGTEGWRWQGCIFTLPCPVFDDGEAVLTLLQALAPQECFDPFIAFSLWQMLMRYASSVPLPSEA